MTTRPTLVTLKRKRYPEPVPALKKREVVKPVPLSEATKAKLLMVSVLREKV